jgi:hypothetical protein
VTSFSALLLLALSAVALLAVGGADSADGTSRPSTLQQGLPPPPPSINGDVDCDGDVDPVDALRILRFIAGMSVIQTQPCVPIGSTVSGLPDVWGNVDCSTALNSIDALKVIRHSIALPSSQTEPCPDIGT